MIFEENTAKDTEIIRSIGRASGEAMWKEIDDLVVRWARRNPFGANWNRVYNQQKRDELKDQKFASSYDKNTGIITRSTIAVHPELMQFIETFYPKFFESKENIRRFGNTYKMFRIPDSL